MVNFSDKLISFVGTTLRQNPTLLNFIREEKYRAEDTNLSYRQLNSLEDAKLLKNSRTSKKSWRNFSLNDLFYLHIISKTRIDFNTNNSKLLGLKTNFYSDTLNLKDIGEIFYSEIALIALLLKVIPVGILIYSDGESIFTDNEASATFPFFTGNKDLKGRSCIYLMLYSTFQNTIEKVIEDKDFKKSFNLDQLKTAYLAKPTTSKQRAILEIIEKGDYSEISIKKKKNGELVINAVKTVDGSKINRKDIMALYSEIKYGSVELIKQDDKDASFRIKNVFKI